MSTSKGKGILSDPLVQFLLGAGAGAIGGYLANKEYKSSTSEEKKQWAKNRLMHHGELGCIAATTGVATGSPFMTGIGAGLALTDLKDADEWFSERRKKEKPKFTRS